MSNSNIHRWLAQFSDASTVLSKKYKPDSNQEELNRLRKENLRLKQEHEILKNKVSECDQRIEVTLNLLERRAEPEQPLPKARYRTKQPNALNFDVRTSLYQMLGVDLTQIHGIGPSLALKLISECGTDMSRWPSSKHFTSWLCLSPGNKISGGKILSSKTRRSSSHVTAALRLAATTVGKTSTALGAFYRRLGARVGKAKAVTATARKIATLFYNRLRYGMSYVDPGADYYEERYQKRLLAHLSKRAAALGYVLQENKTSLPGSVGVS